MLRFKTGRERRQEMRSQIAETTLNVLEKQIDRQRAFPRQVAKDWTQSRPAQMSGQSDAYGSPLFGMLEAP